MSYPARVEGFGKYAYQGHPVVSKLGILPANQLLYTWIYQEITAASLFFIKK